VEKMGNNRKDQIMVVEDEESLRGLATALLKGAGYRVCAFADGKSAITHYKEHSGDIDLVLLDFGLPEIDGIETFRQLQEIKKETIAFLLSGNPEEAQFGIAYGYGVELCLPKPVRPSRLLGFIEVFLGEKT
jgi:CheY-like chemotaxis protein